MSEELENIQAPNWLSELEKKRENRLKARLGHEAGAGAPCIQCNEKCPGLDLHFWRKICKNCKCSKEDHDVHDDDIYGWAQFQLLGSKPSGTRKKIVLPGKKDEVELEWTPKGNTETIDNYLKTLPAEALPVRGSQAAQDRKQLLQKQIPIHDIDPTLCHELTESELAQMQEYIANMKNSAGVGQIIQCGVHYMNEANSKVINDRVPQTISSLEAIQLLGENRTAGLTKQFGKLGVEDQKELDAFFDRVPKPQNMTAHSEKLGYMGGEIDPQVDQNTYNYAESSQFTQQNPIYARRLPSGKKLGYVGQPPTGDVFAQTLPHLQTNYAENIPKDSVVHESTQNYPDNRENPKLGYVAQQQNLSHLSPLYAQNSKNQNLSYPEYHSFPLQQQNRPLGNEPATQNVGYGSQPPLNYIPGQNPTPQPINYAQSTEINMNVPKSASQFAREQILNETNELTNELPPYGEYTNEINRNLPPLSNYNPTQMTLSESNLTPNMVKIGAIRDISYDPEIKEAVFGENLLYEGLTSSKVPDDVNIATQQCRKCAKFFQDGEFAIFVEKLKALYHSECFKCSGCNQILADLIYFYDKESDNIYCGRDFAKIKGIPRCKACDELIFVKEYCLAESNTFHLKHFCCFECDQALAGQNYVVEDSQPLCLPCFEKLKANRCLACSRVIAPDEQGLSLADGHFHATEECFCCWVCKKSLHGAKLLFRNKRLYCSHDCFRGDQK